jgi:hypothetical protein
MLRSCLVKGASFVAAAIFAVSAGLAVDWIIALNVQDPTWRFSTAVVVAMAIIATPGAVSSILGPLSSHRSEAAYQRRAGGPTPGPARESGQVGIRLKQYTDHYLSDSTILGSHSGEFQKQLSNEMYESARLIYSADNPFGQCRQKLSAYVVNFASWQVLCLKRADIGSEDEFRSSPYISGRLFLHIRDCAKYSTELAEFLSRNNDAADEGLITLANARTCAFLYLMSCMNIVRRDVDDFARAKFGAKADWFDPFVRSMLIWKEDDYRRKAGLPTLLPSELAWRHATFLTYVSEGVDDPLSHWEAEHQLKHGLVS